MQNTTKKLTVRAELRATTLRSDIASQLMKLGRDALSGDIDAFAASKSVVYGAIGRSLHSELSSLRDADSPRARRIKRLLNAREREIDLDFFRDLGWQAFNSGIRQVEADEVEHAVVAGDCIMSVGETPAEAAEGYAATGLDVRPDGSGGWEARSVSDIDWQPVTIIRISPDLAAHIRQHGAPASWDTIDGVAHLEREAA